MAAENGSSKSAGSRLLGKVAVVTGGSSGIGLAIASALASEASSILLTGRNQETLDHAAAELSRESAGKGRVLALQCDIRDNEAIARMFVVLTTEFGQLDILVNNAGISQSARAVQETSIDLWRDIIETNL